MPRPRRYRMIGLMPETTYFKPAGVRMAELEESLLTVDEYESVRLKDLEEMDQKEAAEKMQISQPTFNRLIKVARKKIADAIVNGKSIRIEGGKFKMVQQPGMGRGRGQGSRGRMGGSGAGPGGICKCPSCSHEEPQQRGMPCMDRKCPKCGTMMTRG